MQRFGWYLGSNLNFYMIALLPELGTCPIFTVHKSPQFMIENNLHLVNDVLAHYRRGLTAIYPEGEIEQFLRMAFEEIMNLSKIDVLLKTNAPIGHAQWQQFEAILQGLQREEPIQYLLGSTLFYGLRIKVNPAVLIPRPETEELVHWVLNDEHPPRPRIIDFGTGSGCIALALKSHIKDSQVFGVDNNVAALNLANRNGLHNQLQVEFFHFDLLQQESLGFMDFDVMVSNPPYITPSEKALMHRNVLDHEPHNALFAPEDDPLIFYRKIVDLADGHLNRGGKLYFEINRAFGTHIVQLLRDRAYSDVQLRKDLNGNDRMIRATRS